MSKVIHFILFTFVIISLSECDTQTNFHEKDYEFVNLVEKDGKLLIYNPCDASIRKIIIRGDSLYIQTQLDGMYNKQILRKDRISNKEFHVICQWTDEEIDTIRLKNQGELWEITGRIYTEESKIDQFDYVEQPCIECFSKQECDQFMNTNSNDHSGSSQKALSPKEYKEERAITRIESKWYGTYYFKGGDFDLDYILSFTDKDLRLTTQARQYGYTDQLKAIQVGDTLGLFHHKNISGANYDNTRSYDFLKFYKSSDGKFYFEGKLPYLPEGAIEFEKIK
ncbi:hypothetical protein LVD15_11290 [Fulvivirga maritima]|uniref:hypothetical protein n=1 Tax=Fulvivirga maritima TaxID=2904247 RepID=UPI001F1631EA|nr:hypothetical protein [Fulvivirga maritima]UII28981.1 hypothetical protein LVD15_11290 [Fulvivirga maritima]